MASDGAASATRWVTSVIATVWRREPKRSWSLFAGCVRASVPKNPNKIREKRWGKKPALTESEGSLHSPSGLASTHGEEWPALTERGSSTHGACIEGLEKSEEKKREKVDAATRADFNLETFLRRVTVPGRVNSRLFLVW
jgi:hypothetical protein